MKWRASHRQAAAGCAVSSLREDRAAAGMRMPFRMAVYAARTGCFRCVEQPAEAEDREYIE